VARVGQRDDHKRTSPRSQRGAGKIASRARRNRSRERPRVEDIPQRGLASSFVGSTGMQEVSRLDTSILIAGLTFAFTTTALATHGARTRG
jgi:hypothetical protein